MNYTEKEMAIANKTARSSGASVYAKDGSIRSVVARMVDKLFAGNKDVRISDFGSGKSAIQTMWLRSKGFQFVDPHDFGDNRPVDDRFGLNYDVVFASNVINVASSRDMIKRDFEEMKSHTINGGAVLWNYPSSPRKSGLSTEEMLEIAKEVFGEFFTDCELSSPVYIAPVTHGYEVRSVWRTQEGVSLEEEDRYEHVYIVRSREDGETIFETTSLDKALVYLQ